MRTNVRDHGFDFVYAGEVDTMVHNVSSIANTAPFI